MIVRFQDLFNILYDERLDCKLIRSNLVEDRMLNWNRINGKKTKHLTLYVSLAQICFNYLQ